LNYLFIGIEENKAVTTKMNKFWWKDRYIRYTEH